MQSITSSGTAKRGMLGDRRRGCGSPSLVAAGSELGIWGVPESVVGMLPGEAAGLAAIELGYGTAYALAWLARRGARVVGIDNSSAQPRAAARLQEEFDLSFPILQADAGHMPFADA